MGGLSAVYAMEDDGRAWWSDFWYSDPGHSTGAGVRVNADSVMGIPAVYACTTIISEDIAKVPLQMFEDMGDKGRRRASNHPIDDVISEEPNPYQTGIEFKEMMQAFALLRKFGLAEILPGPRGAVDTLWPLHPDLIREERSLVTGMPRYIYRDPKNNFAERTILSDEAFVIRGKLSRSVLDYAKDSLGLELAMDRYQGFLFSRGVKAQGAVTVPKPFANDTIRRGVRKGLDEYSIGGSRAGRPLLLEDGMTWQNVSISNHDAQYDAIRTAGLRQVCRWFRMQPSKVADLADYHYATIEAENINYVTDTLLSHAIRWEQAIRRDLIGNKTKFYARLNLDALLRGDTKSRADAHAIAVQWGWLTRNEVRALENRNPIKGLDEPLTPMNMSRRATDNQQQPTGPTNVSDLTPVGRGHLKLIASGVAERLVRREHAAVSKLAAKTDGQTFREGLEAFYTEHAEEVARDLALPAAQARKYAREQRTAVLADGPMVMDTWLEDRVTHLTDLAMEKTEIAA